MNEQELELHGARSCPCNVKLDDCGLEKFWAGLRLAVVRAAGARPMAERHRGPDAGLARIDRAAVFRCQPAEVPFAREAGRRLERYSPDNA